jgi:large conductance mechanosensitive channel
MPIVGLATGKMDFSNMFVSLNGQSYPTVAAAKAAGAPTLNYGIFINTVIEFLIVALVIFLIVKQVNRLMPPPPPPPPAEVKDCPQCFTKIPLQAKRCPACTSTL